MIIVKLHGGLGNQLFQYAFARAVSARLQTEFRLDPYAFHTYYKLHKYSLDHFMVREQFCRDSDLCGFVWLRKHENAFNWIFRHIFRKKSMFVPFYHFEPNYRFDPSVFAMNATYFDGYWNTEKYFAPIAAELRAEIVLKEPLSTYSQGVYNQIQRVSAVSLHVRRADYVTNKKVEAAFGSCSPEYYAAAIARVTAKVPAPHFFIFSDDQAWAAEHFKSLPYPVTCVTNTAEKNYEDLMLMAACRHNIIANSSFSWWGAWLNRHPDKMVIAPKTWFQSAHIDTADVVPASWIRV